MSNYFTICLLNIFHEVIIITIVYILLPRFSDLFSDLTELFAADYCYCNKLKQKTLITNY